MRVHTVTLAALAVAAGFSLAACNGDDGDSAKGGDATSSSAAPSPSSAAPSGDGSGSDDSQQDGGKESPGGSTGGQDTDAGSAGNGAPARCHTGDLKISAKDSTISGDPEPSVTVTLKNDSGQDCTIFGYAGVNLNTSEGSVPAKRAGQQGASAVLKAGKATFFPITYPANKSGGTGAKITGLVVTPPNETKSVTLNWPGESSLPVTTGDGASVKIGPVGSAGQGGAGN